MISETARSWLQSLTFLINMRNGLKARSMMLTMVYNKMSRLKNVGDKSIGEVRFKNSASDVFIGNIYNCMYFSMIRKDCIKKHL